MKDDKNLNDDLLDDVVFNDNIHDEGLIVYEDIFKMEEEEKKLKKAKKKSFRKGMISGLLTAIGLIFIIGAIITAITIRAIPGLKTVQTSDNVATSSNEVAINMKTVQKKVKMIEQIINELYLFDVDSQKVEDGIYTGMMEALDDPYSVYYREDEFADLIEDQSSQYSGIGAVLTQKLDTKDMVVLQVYKDSPAAEAGLQSGDIIIKVDGIDVTGMDMDLVVKNNIRGPEGTDVTITVLRGKNLEEKKIKITRRQITAHTVEYEMKENNIGYIQVTQFTEVTADQYIEAVDNLTAQGAHALIIDMRDNPGGLVDAAVKMLDYTLPDGLLVYTADRNGKGQEYYSEDGHQVDLPMVILANEYSASAAEIFTGAMIDYEWAYVVGNKTFGKGIVQSVLPLGDGSGVKITQYHYYTPNGTDLHGEGLEPDFQVDLSEDCKAFLDENDTQYQAAIEHLKKLTD